MFLSGDLRNQVTPSDEWQGKFRLPPMPQRVNMSLLINI